MESKPLYNVWVYVGDDIVDRRDHVPAWSRREAYNEVKNDFKHHTSWDAARVAKQPCLTTAAERSRILELDAKRTPGRWYYTTCYGVATIETKRDPIAHGVEYLKYKDADYIEAVADLAPKLAREVETLQHWLKRYVLDHGHPYGRGGCAKDHFPDDPCNCGFEEMRRFLLEDVDGNDSEDRRG